MYTVEDFGAWQRYTPDTLPPGAPPNALFSRRVSDGADWYDIIHERPDSPALALAPDEVIATCLPVPAGLLVQAVVRDPQRLFPGNGQVIRIRGVDPANETPWKLFEQQIVDLKTGTIAPPPEPVPSAVSKAQGKIALRDAGHLAQVKAIMAQADEEAQIWWEDASYWERDSTYIAAIGAQLNLTPADIDALFIAAAKIKT